MKTKAHTAWHRVKSFLHPSSVTWKTPKATTHDSLVVLGAVVASGAFLAVADIVLGMAMRVIL